MYLFSVVSFLNKFYTECLAFFFSKFINQTVKLYSKKENNFTISGSNILNIKYTYDQLRWLKTVSST